MGLDAEWKVPINADGHVCGPPDKAALIQIGYRDEDNQLQVSMYHVRRLKLLPRSLADLLHHKSIRFAGNGVTGDLSKISRDFSNIHIDTKNAGVNLYKMVTQRGVLVNGKGIDAISAVLLGERVDKGPRLSDWSMPNLSTNLRMYAAKDARNSLLCHEHLAKLPDLTESPSPNEIKAGLKVDIAPYMGSNYTIGSCAAIGEIDMNQKWLLPANLKMPMPKVIGGSPGWYVVKVKKVIAPSMAIKELKIGRRYATLKDMGDPPFTIPFPLCQLHKHVESRAPVVTNKREQQIRARQLTELAKESQKRLKNNPLIITFEEEGDEEDDEEGDKGEDISEDNPPTADDSLHDPLQIAEIQKTIEDAMVHAALPGKKWVERPGVKLDPPPENYIRDHFKVVLGSPFHLSHRCICPMHHSYKKAFFVALSEALYAWNQEDMKILVDLLATELDLSEDEIVAWTYFKRRFFARRVRRFCLPPSRLYWRVRNVFETFGTKRDEDTNKALFNNKKCWVVANNILKGILEGYYSDPPDENLYTYDELTAKGEIKYDALLGLPLLECS